MYIISDSLLKIGGLKDFYNDRQIPDEILFIFIGIIESFYDLRMEFSFFLGDTKGIFNFKGRISTALGHKNFAGDVRK